MSKALVELIDIVSLIKSVHFHHFLLAQLDNYYPYSSEPYNLTHFEEKKSPEVSNTRNSLMK